MYWSSKNKPNIYRARMDGSELTPKLFRQFDSTVSITALTFGFTDGGNYLYLGLNDPDSTRPYVPCGYTSKYLTKCSWFFSTITFFITISIVRAFKLTVGFLTSGWYSRYSCSAPSAHCRLCVHVKLLELLPYSSTTLW